MDDLTTDSVPAVQNQSRQHEKECKPDDEYEYFDGGILYDEDDFEKVDDFMEDLRAITLQDGSRPRVDFYDLISENPDQFKRIEGLIEKCSCVILYVTNQFLANNSLLHHLNEIVLNAINKNSKNWTLMILVNSDLELPIGMRSLTITKLHKNRDFAFKKLKKSLQEAQNRRKMKERQSVTSKEDQPKKNIPLSRDNIRRPIYKTTVININNAEYAQVGNNPKMYGLLPCSPDTEESSLSKDISLSPEMKTEQPNVTKTGKGGDLEYNISGQCVQIHLPSQATPDPDRDSRK